MPYGTINVDLMTTSDGVSSSGLYGFKNRIINGAMVIDQRNAGASVTASGAFPVDRFKIEMSQASKVTWQQNAGSVTPPTGYKYYAGATVGASANVTVGAGDYFIFEQQIEGYNIADLGWGTASASPVTLSFWVRSSTTGTFGGVVSNNNNRSYPFTYTISSANTWEQKSITISGDTSGAWNSTNGCGIFVNWSLGTGSTYSGTASTWAGSLYFSATGASTPITTNSATFYITGVMLEKGSTATSFDYRPYGAEFALCQRYYQNLLLFAQNSGGALSIIRASSSGGANESNINIQGPTMRTNPTATAVAGSSNILYGSSFGSSGSSFTYTLTTSGNSNVTGQVLRFRGGPVLTDGTAYVLWNNGGDLYAKLDAEL